ncbi:UTRA domain-containing protein [Phytohabitans sp. ZYX-F-186]|uniref:UTRA domain-containing protein n=1 Tax=Phytohabitans maris TaxID=3071409 RepID=A0ABU0ZEF6_9ACTN|nr:UTRA domain-containing protein [Phytohabitans sp. ZYX-F-186]MDQ7904700.1 UTRA domain-containing protein [Phytohabitans sp. ZYX-F-186]
MAEPGTWVSVSTPYVTPRSPGDREAWAAEAAQHGHTGTQRLIEVSEVAASPVVAEALRLAADEPVVVRRRLMLLDDKPVELTDSYYPTAIARGTPLAEPRKIPGGAVTLLAELGHRPRRITEDVSSREPTAHERAALALDPQEWVLRLIRVAATDSGQPVEASMITMKARHRHLRYQLTID